MAEEGWYTDPYQRHDARWFSDGTPTPLVRDGETTSSDPPPATPYVEVPRLIEPPPSRAADDLRRGGDEPAGDGGVQAIRTYFTRGSSGF